MIYNEVDEHGKVKIRFGDLATLVAESLHCGLFHEPDFIDAVYLGFTLETRKLHGECSDGEGHLFAKLDGREGLSFYLAHNLKMGYWSDGSDDPSYAVGISVWKKDNIGLTQSERSYVLDLIKKRNRSSSL